jgi:hypothetical protein
VTIEKENERIVTPVAIGTKNEANEANEAGTVTAALGEEIEQTEATGGTAVTDAESGTHLMIGAVEDNRRGARRPRPRRKSLRQT